MNKRGLLISSAVIVITVFSVVAYSIFNTLGITQSRVVRNEITIVTGSAEKLYDGTAISNDEWYIESGDLAEGDTLETSMNTVVTDPASVDNEIGVTIFNSEGRNVTVNYKIHYKLGTITVRPIELTIFSENKSKYFDGSPLTSNEWLLQAGQLLEGHTIDVSMNSTITMPGTVDNEVDVRILNGSGENMNHLYGINYNLGQLTVFGRDVTVYTDNFEKSYDGTPLMGGDVTVVGDISDTNRVEFGDEISITNPGTRENARVIRIYDNENNDITEYYNITYNYGTLTVLPISVVLESANDSKTYDGTPLSNSSWNLVYGDLAPGHTLDVTVNNSITEVGSIENTIYAQILDASGNTVTNIYELELNPGTLTVEAKNLTISTVSDSKTYDGTDLTRDGYSLDLGELSPGHVIDYVMSSSITLPGTIDNEISLRILDQSGNDVTSEYEITYNLGELVVSERNIVISTETREKGYDGTPLLGGTGTLSAGDLALDHTIQFGSEVSLTNPDTIDNEIDVVIYDGSGNDVTAGYNITKNSGTLTVRPISIILKSYDDSKVYDGLPLSNDDYDLLSGDLLAGHNLVVDLDTTITDPATVENTITAYIVNTSGNDVTHMYEISYILGDLTVYPRNITIATGTFEKGYDGTSLDGGTAALVVGTLADGHTTSFGPELSITYPDSIDNAVTVKIFDGSGNDVTIGYEITKDYGTLTIYPISIIIKSPDATKLFDGTPLSDNTYEILNGEVLDGHTLVVDVDNEITYPGTTPNTMITYVIDQFGNDVSTTYDIESLTGTLEIIEREITLSTVTLSKSYDGDPLDGGLGTVTGNLLPTHNVVYGTQSSITNPGSITNSITITIFDDLGNNVTAGYDITNDFGDLTIDPISIFIKSPDATKTYDGLPLSDNTWELLNGFTLPGHTLVVDVDNSITDPGTTPNTMTAYVVDGSGNDVTNAYDITHITGDLTVEAIQITITTNDDSKAYDGSALTSLAPLLTGSILPTHTISYGPPTSITNPGSITNTVVVIITDGSGNDMTGGYDITTDYGTLTINPISIIIKSPDGSKPYDGTELSDNTWELLNGATLPGHTLVVDVDNSITNPGSTPNTMNAYVIDGSGNDVSDAYDIEHITGTLTIQGRSITVSTGTHSKTYDGTELTGGTGSHDAGVLDPDHTIVFGPEISITDPGTVTNNVTITVLDSLGNDVTVGYDVTYNYGELTIDPITIVIKSPNDSKTYDGTELTNNTYQLLSGTLLPGHNLVVDVDNTITNPGIEPNTMVAYVIDGSGNDVSDAYSIEHITGDLTVYAIDLTIHTITDSKPYDGTELLGGSASITAGALASGHNIQYGPELSITNPGTIDNDITVAIYDGLGNDVTVGYNITYDYGTLTIDPIQIIIKSPTETKIYDGTPLSNNTYEVLSGILLPGHTLIVDVDNSITNPDTIDNTMNAYVIDGGGNNVSTAYDIEHITGTLTVEPINITIATGTDSKGYDGTELLGGTGNIIFGSLRPGDYIVWGPQSSITLPGQIINEIDLLIYDEFNNDVTAGYHINTNFGTLTIDPILLVISSPSESKEYDGTPLSNNTWTLVSGTVLEGHNLVVDMNNEITEVGTIPNSILAIVVDNSDNDVSNIYDITLNEGDLTVYSSGHSSTQLASSSFDLTPTDVFTTSSGEAGIIYYRNKSFSDYTGSGWTQGVDHDTGITTNPLLFASIALLESGRTTTTVTVDYIDETIGFLTPYHTTDVPTGDSDVHLPGDTSLSSSFNSILYTYNDSDDITLQTPALIAEELTYRNYVYNTYLAVPTSTKTELLTIAYNNGLSQSSPTIINDVKTYIQGAATYNLDFTTIPLEEDMVLYFLNVTQEGICQHFAASATLMYRSLGVPARYVTGYVSEVDANTPTAVQNIQGHAWVEVYIDGFGWLPIEVTGGGATGTGSNSGSGSGSGTTEELIEITVQPYTVREEYVEGITITASQLVIMGYPNFESEGYTYDVTYGGSLSEIGVATSTIATFTIFDDLGNNVTNQFDITFNTGELQLYGYEITLVTGSGTHEYDGSDFKVEDYSIVGALEPGHYVHLVSNYATITNVGTKANTAHIFIFDDLGNNVTSYYNILKDYGDLTVTPRSITIESGSANKKLDYTPLTDDTFEITDGSLAPTETIDVEITGSQIMIGESNNTISNITIYNNGVDVTENYTIVTVEGLLTVNPPY